MTLKDSTLRCGTTIETDGADPVTFGSEN